MDWREQTHLARASALLLAVALSGCDAPDSSPLFAAANPPPPNTGASAEALAVFSLSNAFRASNSVAPLSLSPQLTTSAQTFAEAMATQGFFSHNSPDGTTPADRISAAGYSWSTWGENIAYYYGTPDAVMQAWINSPGHRANLLSASFTDIGLGYAVNANGTAYWVQDFGRP